MACGSDPGKEEILDLILAGIDFDS